MEIVFRKQIIFSSFRSVMMETAKQTIGLDSWNGWLTLILFR